jgi:uncharacterized membrane-anchored protein
MENLGRYLILAGVGLVVVGAIVFWSARFGMPLGRLPGDFRFEWQGMRVYIPLATSILLSVILTLIVNVILRLLRK